MNILILNWRDPKNPKSGGAEKLNMHILKPFIERGDEVVWYAMSVKGLPKQEVYKGITIIRYGNPFTHLFAWPWFYWTKKFGNIDFIIDSIHGTGYMSSLIAPKVKKIILICEVAQNIWDEMYPFPINVLGKLWEKVMFKFYRNNKFWTISQSTKKDLTTFGVPSKNVEVLPMGFDAVDLGKLPPKYKNPTALFVGRLAEMKGIKDAIKAIAEVNKNAAEKWELNIIGRGEDAYEKELRRLVSDLGLKNEVHFLGFVDEKMKFEEMAKAWVLIVPSSREGWGMIVPEANYVGTPAIGYAVPGLSEVLEKYAQENKKVNVSYQHLADELQKLVSPRFVKPSLNPGWQELYSFVSQ